MRRATRTCAVLLAGTLLAGGLPAQAPPPQEGVRLLKEGRFEEALPALDAELKADPQDAGLGVARGRCLLALGRWEEAASAAKALAESHPGDVEAHLLLGDCLFGLFRPLEAAAEYGRIGRDSRWGAVALVHRMQALEAAGRTTEALEEAGRWEASGVSLPDEVLAMLGLLQARSPRAIPALEALAKRRPEDATVQQRLALERALAALPPAPAPAFPSQPVKSRIREIYGEPCVPVSIDGTKRRWITFDTGAENILVNGDTAKKLHLPVLGAATFEGWGYRGARETTYVLLSSLEAAGISLRNAVGLVDERRTEFYTNKAGTLGLGPFRRGVVLYDRRHGRFEVWPAGTSAASLAPAATATLPLMWSRGLPLVPVTVQGKGPFPFLLDTGGEFTLLDERNSKALGVVINSGKYGNVRAWGVSGAFSSGIAETVTLDVGGKHYDRPLALVTQVPQRFPVPVYGILGREILRDFILVIDGPGCAVTFEPYDRK